MSSSLVVVSGSVSPAGGALASVTNGLNVASYTYLANSPVVSQIVFKTNNTTRMTTTKQYDLLNRLQQIASAPGASGVSPVSFGYTYNTANQRTGAAQTDSSYWVYGLRSARAGVASG